MSVNDGVGKLMTTLSVTTAAVTHCFTLLHFAFIKIQSCFFALYFIAVFQTMNKVKRVFGEVQKLNSQIVVSHWLI